MNLGQIKTQFTGLINRRDLAANPSLVTTFIDQAVMRIQRELRCPAMEKGVLVTIASPYNGLVIPSDFLELIRIVPQESMLSLDKTDITRAARGALVQGCPKAYCRQGALWVLTPAPCTGNVIRIDYYAELAPLVADTDTNVIATVAWDLIVYAALSAAGDWFGDRRAQGWEQRYSQILDDLQEQADEDELEGAAQVVPAYRIPDEWEEY